MSVKGASTLAAALEAVAGARGGHRGAGGADPSSTRTPQRAAHVDLENLISDLSVALATATVQRVERDVEQALGRLLCALEVGRASFFRFSPDGRLSLLHSVAAPGVKPSSAIRGMTSFPGLPACSRPERWCAWTTLPQDYPVEAGNERAAAQFEKARAELAIPLRVAGKVAAAISVVDFRGPRDWPEQVLLGLRTVGEILAHALVRQAAAEQSVERLRFERLLADLSATFANLHTDQVDAEIRFGLDRLLTFLGLDRVCLLEVGREDGHFRALHEVVANAKQRPAQTAWEEQLPWWAEQLRRGEVLAWTNLPDDISAPRGAGARVRSARGHARCSDHSAMHRR